MSSWSRNYLLLRIPNVHNSFHRSPSSYPVPVQFHPVHIFTSHVSEGIEIFPRDLPCNYGVSFRWNPRHTAHKHIVFAQCFWRWYYIATFFYFGLRPSSVESFYEFLKITTFRIIHFLRHQFKRERTTVLGTAERAIPGLGPEIVHTALNPVSELCLSICL
jgi:hypothetical protein